MTSATSSTSSGAGVLSRFNGFNNNRIGNRLLIAMVLPVAGLLVYAGLAITDRLSVQQKMHSSNELAQLAPTVSALVHEMQKERGQSAGFIGNKGQTFSDTLPTQHRDTTARRRALIAELTDFDAANYGSGLVEKVNLARQALDGLDSMRNDDTALTATVPQMAGYYTGTIAGLLGIVEEMVQASHSDSVSKAITADIAFLQAKERAGIERAMGSGGFGAGAFPPAIYRNFLQLIAMQDTFMSSFNLYATVEQRAVFQQTVAGDAVNEVARMRQIAIDSAQTGDIGGIAGPY